MMRRKRAVAYIKVNLVDDVDSLVRELEAWCKRRRIVLVEAVEIEAAEAQPKLHKLLSSLRTSKHVDFLVTPSFYHFSSLPKFLRRLAELQTSDCGIGFARERILLPRSSSSTKSILTLAAHYVEDEKVVRSRAIKQSLRVAALYGRVQSKKRIPENIIREAAAHLRAGRSLRETSKLMRSKISRSSLWSLRKELKKRGTE